MSHWLEKVVVLLKADTKDLRELARLAGGNPKTFYLGVDRRKIDFRGQDVQGMRFSDPPQQLNKPASFLLAVANNLWAVFGGVTGSLEEKRLDKVERQQLQLEQAVMRSQERFQNAIAHTATISHELRGPLTTVLGMADLILADKDLTPKQRERMLAILSASKEMEALTDAVAHWDWEKETVDFTRVPPERPIKK